MTNAIKVGVIAAVLLVTATIAGWDDIEWPVYTGVALLVIAYVWSRSSLVAIGFERTLDADRVFAGDPVRERFRVTNHSRIPRNWILMRDESSLPGYDPSRSVRVGSRDETRWTSELMAERRGRFRLGPITLESGDPFGLFDTRMHIEQTHELTVYPRIVELPERTSPGGDLSGASKSMPGRSLSSPIIRSVRQYVTGDPWNQIAWRASARHTTLLVKEFDPDPISDEWIFLDLDADAERTAKSTTEYAISLAASFALEWLTTGRDVGLLVNRSIPAIVEADAGDRQRLRILETLAVVEPFGEADPSELIARYATKFSRATGLVVISTGDGSGFVAPLRHLLHHSVPLVIVAVSSPDSAGGVHDHWLDVEAEGVKVMRIGEDGDHESPSMVATLSERSA